MLLIGHGGLSSTCAIRHRIYNVGTCARSSGRGHVDRSTRQGLVLLLTTGIMKREVPSTYCLGPLLASWMQASPDSELSPVLLCVRIAHAGKWAGECVISPARFVKAARSDSELSPVLLCIEHCPRRQMGWRMRDIANLLCKSCLPGVYIVLCSVVQQNGRVDV